MGFAALAFECPILPRCPRKVESIRVSRIVYGSNEKILMPVQWDSTGEMWDTVVALATSYEYAEPPVTGLTCDGLDDADLLDPASMTRWPMNRYEVRCVKQSHPPVLLACREPVLSVSNRNSDGHAPLLHLDLEGKLR